MKTQCPKCGSRDLAKNGSKKGKQRYRCNGCGFYFTDNSEIKRLVTKSKKMGGISVELFRKEYDVVFILSQVPEKFQDDTLYEKSDIIKMAGLTANFKGIPTVLESSEWKQYKGRVNQKDWYAKPALIKKLKDEGILS